MRFNRTFPAVLATTLLCTLIASAGLAAQRVPLFEEATNTSCGPCASYNPIIEQIFNDFGEQIAKCKYHAWWPGSNDPFYQHNIPANTTRINYYGINGVPDVCVDGANGPSPGSYASMQSYLNGRLATPSPLIIEVDGVIQSGFVEVDVDVTVETPQVGTSFRLFTALIEDYIHFNAPNGEDHHLFTFRRFGDDMNTGEVIDLSSAGTQSFHYSIPFNEQVYQLLEMSVTAWVQNYSTREVLQGGHGGIPVPYYVTARPVGATTKIGGTTEVVTFEGEVENLGANQDTYDVSVSGVPAGWAYSYTTPSGTYSGPSTLTLAGSELAAVSLELDSQGNAGPADVTIDFESQAVAGNTASLEYSKINGAQVLIVDDDGGAERETYLEAALTAAGVTWGTYDRDGGALTVQNLQDAAQSVFWMCGITYGLATPSVTPEDRDALAAFMDAGGNVCLSGSNVTYDIGEPTSPNYSAAAEQWMADYFKVDHEYNHSFSFTVDGTPGDPIGDGFTGMLFESSAVNGNYQDTPDGIAALPGGELVFTWAGTIARGDACVRYAGGYKSILFGAGIEGIREEADRHEIVARIIEWFGGSVAVEDPQGMAPLVRLAQNVPNPFRPSTSINYELGRPGAVSLRVYDVQGRLVRELVDGHQDAVAHSVLWDGTDDAGRAVSSGVYFYRLEAPGVTETRRMVLSR